MRYLIVHSDPEVRDQLAALVEGAGHTVACRAGYSGAHTACGDDPIHAIIFDAGDALPPDGLLDSFPPGRAPRLVALNVNGFDLRPLRKRARVVELGSGESLVEALGLST